jgi:15-cis-phytoene synthase
MAIAVPLNLTAAQSHAWCERLARREAGNFYHAFRILPMEQRRAMCALYAFMRITDDLSDGPEDNARKRMLLEDWRRRLLEALAGEDSHAIHPALRQTVLGFEIPPRYLEDVLDGVTMDLDTDRYETFEDLYPYCYRVASAVGLACIHIWGFQGKQAKRYAESAGIALQLTNILRDLGEDSDRGRVYLPQEDLQRFGYNESSLNQRTQNECFREMMRFQVARAQQYYDAAEPLTTSLRPAGRAVFLVMLRTYHGLLKAIVRRDYDVFSSRVQLSKLHKLWLAARALPVRWGLL